MSTIYSEATMTLSKALWMIQLILHILVFVRTANSSDASSNATVMALGTGYGVDVFKRFVGSLRNSGYKGNIILILSPNPRPGVEEYLASRNVTMKRMEIIDCDLKFIVNEEQVCAKPYPNMKIRMGRFALIRDYLKECKKCTGPVLVTDVRDVLFQLDPFGDEAPEVTGLQVFEENRIQKTTHWLVRIPVQGCKNIVFDEVMLCSGTTIGTREAMLQYLDIMCKEMIEWNNDPKCCCSQVGGKSIHGDDQAIHNYLYYTGKLPFARAIKNRMGIVHTVGVTAGLILHGHSDTPLSSDTTWLGPEYDLVDKEGFFLNYDGTRSRVVHQFDRFKHHINKWLKTNGLSDE